MITCVILTIIITEKIIAEKVCRNYIDGLLNGVYPVSHYHYINGGIRWI